jgi:hypothetical protein
MPRQALDRMSDAEVQRAQELVRGLRTSQPEDGLLGALQVNPGVHLHRRTSRPPAGS